MKDFTDLIMGRRSIRRYQEKDVPTPVLDSVLEAVRWAPSWANSQCWEVVVVKDREIKARIQQTVSSRNPSFRAIVDAPVLVVVCGKLKSAGYYKEEATTKFGDWFMHDLGLATQNICLTAHALGLGTVIVGLFDHDRVREILGVPDGYEVVSLLPLGYPGHKSTAPQRRQVSDFVHYEKF